MPSGGMGVYASNKTSWKNAMLLTRCHPAKGGRNLLLAVAE
jgi:hypothetical protein